MTEISATSPARRSRLLRGSLRQRRNAHGQLARDPVKVGVSPMTGDHPRRVVVRKPSLARGVLPDERLEGQVDAYRLLRLHERSPRARVAEDQKLRRTQAETHLRRAPRLLDPR